MSQWTTSICFTSVNLSVFLRIFIFAIGKELKFPPAAKMVECPAFGGNIAG
jgi:hypothetical protein